MAKKSLAKSFMQRGPGNLHFRNNEPPGIGNLRVTHSVQLTSLIEALVGIVVRSWEKDIKRLTNSIEEQWWLLEQEHQIIQHKNPSSQRFLWSP